MSSLCAHHIEWLQFTLNHSISSCFTSLYSTRDHFTSLLQWATSPHLTSHQITSHYSTSLFIEWHQITSPYFISDHSNHFASLRFTSHHTHHIIFDHVSSSQFRSLLFSLTNLMWYQMIRFDVKWFILKSSKMNQFSMIFFL